MNIADEEVSTRTQSSATPKPHHYTTPLLYHTNPFCHHHPLWLTPPHHHYHSHHRDHHRCQHRHHHHHQLITFTVIQKPASYFYNTSVASLNKCTWIIWMWTVLWWRRHSFSEIRYLYMSTPDIPNVWTLVLSAHVQQQWWRRDLIKRYPWFLWYTGGTPNCALNKSTGLSTCVHTVHIL